MAFAVTFQYLSWDPYTKVKISLKVEENKCAERLAGTE